MPHPWASLIPLLSLVLMPLGFAGSEGGAVTEGFEMSIRLTKGPSYRADVPIYLDLVVKNATDRKLFYTMSADDLPRFEFTVEYTGGGMTQGGKLPATRYGTHLLQPLDGAKNVPIILGPGETMAYSFPISRMVDMTSSGTYSVQARRSFAAQPAAGHDPRPTSSLVSNALTVDVTETENSVYVRNPPRASR